MSSPPLVDCLREEIRALIAEAVIEPDAIRRLALLATADHWIGVVRPSRSARPGPAPQGGATSV